MSPGELVGVKRAEAEAIYEQGADAVVAVLVALSERVAAQDAQSAKLRLASRSWSGA